MTTARRCGVEGPGLNGRLVVAQDVHHRRVFDEDCLEGWDVARNMVFQHAEVPTTEKFLQRFCQVETEGTRCPESGCTWCRFAFPPDDGVVDGLKCKGAIWFLDVGRKSTQSIALV